MNIIVAGCGRVGSQLATSLSKDGHNVTVIDKNEDSFSRLGSAFNGVTVKGLCFDEDVLISAGAEECDLFAAVTDLDNTNLMAVEVVRHLFGVPRAVARLYNPARESTYDKLGIEYVSGTKLIAEVLHERIEAGHTHYISSFGAVEIRVFAVADSLVGKKVYSTYREGKVLPAIILRNGVTFIPTQETVFESGDVLRVAVREEESARLDKYIKEEF